MYSKLSTVMADPKRSSVPFATGEGVEAAEERGFPRPTKGSSLDLDGGSNRREVLLCPAGTLEDALSCRIGEV